MKWLTCTSLRRSTMELRREDDSDSYSDIMDQDA